MEESPRDDHPLHSQVGSAFQSLALFVSREAQGGHDCLILHPVERLRSTLTGHFMLSGPVTAPKQNRRVLVGATEIPAHLDEGMVLLEPGTRTKGDHSP